jgi:hypothetical protein
MENSDPQLVSNVRKFNRTMTLWGLPYSMLGMWILATIWNAIIPPQPASPFEVILFLVGVFVLVLLPLWWMSHYLRKRYGLICPTCGRWLSIRRENRVRCTHCNPKTPHVA